MAKIEFTGIDEYAGKLRALGKAGIGICKAAVYDGAGIVADAVRESIESMATIDEKEAVIGWNTETPVRGLTEAQKQGLLDGLTLRQMKNENGFIYTEVGFSGYNDVATKKYPSGQPNAMIARSVESGSSARVKRPFVRPAVNTARQAAEAAMEKKINEMVNDIME